MRLADLLERLEELAPLGLAEPWDNVGLLVGDPAAPVERVLLAIDYTPAVAAEARRARAELVVAYHPPIFDALERLVAGDPRSELVLGAARDGVALYSPHTALDVAEGGTSDVLADAVGISAGARTPLRVAEPRERTCKLVTFVPAEHLEAVSAALFAAGAGRIGDYSSCSFRLRGTGTFFGEAGTSPTVGEAGRLERIDEVRLETVVPLARVSDVVAALRRAHPYEEPAFDLGRLVAPPSAVGLGRVGPLEAPVARERLVERLRAALGVERLLVAGPMTGDVERAAVCAGACGGELLDAALAAGAGLYLTGEVRHHDALRAARAGMTVVAALHSNSERPALARLRDRLARSAPGLSLTLSTADRDPFTIL